MSHWNVIVLVGVNVVLLGACLVEWTRRPPARVPAVIVPLPVPPVVEDAASGARGRARHRRRDHRAAPPGVRRGGPVHGAAPLVMDSGARRGARRRERSVAGPRAVWPPCPTRVPAAVGGIAPSKVAAHRAPFSVPLNAAVARLGREARAVALR